MLIVVNTPPPTSGGPLPDLQELFPSAVANTSTLGYAAVQDAANPKLFAVAWVNTSIGGAPVLENLTR